MTRNDLYELSIRLLDCSKRMEPLDENISAVLLEMSSQTLRLLERVNIPKEVQEEIEDIKKEILND